MSSIKYSERSSEASSTAQETRGFNIPSRAHPHPKEIPPNYNHEPSPRSCSLEPYHIDSSKSDPLSQHLWNEWLFSTSVLERKCQSLQVLTMELLRNSTFHRDDPADDNSNAHCSFAATNVARVGGSGGHSNRCWLPGVLSFCPELSMSRSTRFARSDFISLTRTLEIGILLQPQSRTWTCQASRDVLWTWW